MIFLFIQLIQSQSYELINQTIITGEKEFRIKFIVSNYDQNLLFVFQFDDSFQKAYLSIDNINSDQLEGNTNIFFDQQAFVSRNLTQLIEISVEEIDILHIMVLGESSLSGRLNIYSKNISNCINECQGSIINKKIDTQVCSNKKCICNDEMMGNYCQFYRERITVGHLNTLLITKDQWAYLYFTYNKQQTLTLSNIPDNLCKKLQILDISFGVDVQGFEIPPYDQITPLTQFTNIDEFISSYKKFDFHQINIGLYSKIDQSIQIILKENQENDTFQNNFLMILFILFNIFIISGWYWGFRAKKYDQETERRRHKKQSHINQLDEATIEQFFNKIKYADLIIINPEFKDIQICAICQCNIYETSVTITPCNHLFHLDCIKMWLLNEPNCPNCRFKINKEVLERKQDQTKNFLDRSIFQSSFQSIQEIN